MANLIKVSLLLKLLWQISFIPADDMDKNPAMGVCFFVLKLIRKINDYISVFHIVHKFADYKPVSY
ncbi:MAG: hypothetical protein J6C92_01690, partial [Bacteroidaceae bacterium]|nr:hypothetical protein [Bacteroidaceae bacterium]